MQRPIIYPLLDYKYRYPKFTIFKRNIDYLIAESEEIAEKHEKELETERRNQNDGK